MDRSAAKIALIRSTRLHEGALRRFARRSSLALVALLFLLAAGSVQAATDGTLGNLTFATTDVSIIVGETAQASGLTDIVLSPWSDGLPAPFGTTQACVYSSTGGYQVTASSTNGAGTTFRLASGVSHIRYNVRWNDGTSGLTPVSNGLPLTGLVGDSSSPTCSGSTPVTIEVSITNTNISAALFGSYSDTLTVMITPQ